MSQLEIDEKNIDSVINELVEEPIGKDNSKKLIENNDIADVVAPSFGKRVKRVATPMNLVALGIMGVGAYVMFKFPEFYEHAERWFNKEFPSFNQDIPIFFYNLSTHLLTSLVAFGVAKKVKKQKINKREVSENLKFQGVWGTYRHFVYNYALPFVDRVGGKIAEQAAYFMHFWLYSLGYMFATNRKEKKSFKQVWSDFKDSIADNAAVYMLHAGNVLANPFPSTKAIFGSFLTMIYTMSIAMISYKHGNLRTHLSGKIDLKTTTPKDFLRFFYNEDKDTKKEYKRFEEFEASRRSLVKDLYNKTKKIDREKIDFNS